MNNSLCKALWDWKTELGLFHHGLSGSFTTLSNRNPPQVVSHPPAGRWRWWKWWVTRRDDGQKRKAICSQRRHAGALWTQSHLCLRCFHGLRIERKKKSHPGVIFPSIIHNNSGRVTRARRRRLPLSPVSLAGPSTTHCDNLWIWKTLQKQPAPLLLPPPLPPAPIPSSLRWGSVKRSLQGEGYTLWIYRPWYKEIRDFHLNNEPQRMSVQLCAENSYGNTFFLIRLLHWTPTPLN